MDDVANRGLVLLGCGKMGTALLAGWLAQGLPPASVWVLEPAPTPWLIGTGVNLNVGLPASAAVCLLAVKPQMMEAALPSLLALGNGSTLFLSIAAGTRIATLAATLGDSTPIVRAMPNTPAMVGRGITALAAGPGVSDAQMAMCEQLMAAVGQVVRLPGEHLIDAVTGVSGSGPAYVFHLIEVMAAAGVAEGLDPDTAMQLARATVSGAGELAYRSPESAEQLRINVTSPGGTTAAALRVLMDPDAGLGRMMRQAVRAAAERGRELGA